MYNPRSSDSVLEANLLGLLVFDFPRDWSSGVRSSGAEKVMKKFLIRTHLSKLLAPPYCNIDAIGQHQDAHHKLKKQLDQTTNKCMRDVQGVRWQNRVLNLKFLRNRWANEQRGNQVNFVVRVFIDALVDEWTMGVCKRSIFQGQSFVWSCSS